MDTARADALAARDRLGSRGWISPRNESFRHLPPPGANVWLGDADESPPQDCAAPPLAGAGWTLHPVGDTPQSGVHARWLDARDPAQRAELFAGLPLPGADDAAPFAWAHRVLCRQGLRLQVGSASGAPAGKTVWLHLRHQPRTSVEAPLLVVEVHEGTQCVLIETHEREPAQCDHPLAQNLHIHLRVRQGATLQHLRVATPDAADQIAHIVQARVDQGGHYAQALVASGSSYHLQRTVLDLQGPRAHARVGSVLLAHGSALEQQVQTAHNAAHTHSTVEALVLASGNAHAVVNAHTAIAPGAGEAVVRQRLTGIPMEGHPRLVLRPHLEIHHDDVQAAHGATWGALPEDALFYARQRGLDEASARALIIEGMATALLERCLDNPDLLAMWTQDGLLARAIARHLAPSKETRHG